ncbi:hypothetical protein BV502_08550 [Leucobacter sp. OAMLP11]|uniref:helix-turn-helix domain-containing protein n=1 Tax=unclassified Leucobacter TaxID=2621730 RepID=UPI000C185A46|nr:MULTISPECIES: helix-turn-helix transcriptional regulator [unclassified Leucobacter]PIO50387.1 hypothetical protein BV502_08550 [Leucobacter sp. OAMLP11]
MAVTREHELSLAAGLIEAGVNLEVFGTPGSGRSTFLSALGSQLTQAGFSPFIVRGVRAFENRPLAALQSFGLVRTDNRSRDLIGSAAQEIRQRLGQEFAVLLVDDWDSLDSASWGVLDGVRRELHVPVVVARGLHSETDESHALLPGSAQVIEMLPLGFEELEAVVSERLGGAISVATMSRILEASGGIVGLAVQLVEAARRNGHIRFDGGLWSDPRDLWTSGMRGPVRRFLGGLQRNEVETLETLAIVGVIDLDAARGLIEWEVLERLEERGLIQIVQSESRGLVTVTPPLVVDYFRHEALFARRIRIRESIASRLGESDQFEVRLDTEELFGRKIGESDALFVRLLRERARASNLVSRAEWVRRPCPATAVTYLNTLMQTPDSGKEVAEVFECTDPAEGDPLSRARYAAMRARWYAYVDAGDLDRALLELRNHGEDLGVFKRILDTTEVTLLSNFRQVPRDFSMRLEVDDSYPTPVKIAELEGQLFVLIGLGRFEDALRTYEWLTEIPEAPSSQNQALYSLALLGAGRGEEALALCVRGVEEARGMLDIEGVRSFGAVAILCYLIAGDLEQARRLLETIFATGEPSPFATWIHLTFLTAAAVVGVRSGDIGLGERFVRKVSEVQRPDGLLPTHAKAWAQAQLAVFDGQSEVAEEMLCTSASALWERGARFSAATLWLNAADLEGAKTPLDQLLQSAEEIGGGLFDLWCRFLRCKEQKDVAGMLQLAPLLRAGGQHGRALDALKLSASWARDADDASKADDIDVQIQEYLKEFGGRAIDSKSFRVSGVLLTRREREVAQLASTGLSNPEIAARLVLSPRTVESHMHRILRKMNLTSRRDLDRLVRGGSAS